MNEQLELINLMLQELQFRNPSAFYHKELTIEDAEKQDVLGLRQKLDSINTTLKTAVEQKYENNEAAIAEIYQRVEALYNLQCENAATVTNNISGNLIVKRVDGDFSTLTEKIDALYSEVNKLVPFNNQGGGEQQPDDDKEEEIPDTVVINGFEVNNKPKEIPFVACLQNGACYSTFPQSNVSLDAFLNKPSQGSIKVWNNYDGFDDPSSVEFVWTAKAWENNAIACLTGSGRSSHATSYDYKIFDRKGNRKERERAKYPEVEFLALGFGTGLNAIANRKSKWNNYNPFGSDNLFEELEPGKFKITFTDCDFPAACFVSIEARNHNLDVLRIARVTHWERQEGNTVAYIETYYYEDEERKLGVDDSSEISVILLGDGEAITRAFPKDAKINAGIYSNGGDAEFYWSSNPEFTADDVTDLRTIAPEFKGEPARRGSCQMIQMHGDGEFLGVYPSHSYPLNSGKNGFKANVFKLDTGEEVEEVGKRSFIYIAQTW